MTQLYVNDNKESSVIQDLGGPLAVVTGWAGIVLASLAVDGAAVSAIKDVGSWAVIVYLVFWWTRRQEKIFSSLVEELREMRRDIQIVLRDLEDRE
jgi:hypothetical protein